ncbi:sodium/potassium/calcium exchanger 4-like [Pleurodeles waltl]|uniref:sodium/potassium/calcium exchanger 4-like n=1 Tax=Pleurodeles waltl TaxID=8319 RepID=UPI0037097DA2
MDGGVQSSNRLHDKVPRSPNRSTECFGHRQGPQSSDAKVQEFLALFKNFTIAKFKLQALYMFYALAIVCDEYFVPSLTKICEKLNLSKDVAGATFMAAGSSSSELFASIIGVFITHGDVGMATIVGSAVFNILFVVGICGIFTGQVVQLMQWSLLRSCICYTFSVIALIIFITDGIIQWWESLILIFMYAFYILVMKYNKKLQNLFTRNQKTMANGSAVSNEMVNDSASHDVTDDPSLPLIGEVCAIASACRSLRYPFCTQVPGGSRRSAARRGIRTLLPPPPPPLLLLLLGGHRKRKRRAEEPEEPPVVPAPVAAPSVDCAGVPRVAFSRGSGRGEAIAAVQELRSSVFDCLKDGLRLLEEREKAFLGGVQEGLGAVTQDLSELDRLSDLVGKPSENHPLHNSGLLSLDPVRDKTLLFSQLLQAYKWSNKDTGLPARTTASEPKPIYNGKDSVAVVDAIISSSPSKFQIPETYLPIMITTDVGPTTRLTMPLNSATDGIIPSSDGKLETFENEKVYVDKNNPHEEPESNHLCPCSVPATCLNKCKWAFTWPITCIFYLTIPNFSKPRRENMFLVTFLVSILWLGIFSYILVWMVAVIGYTLGIPDVIMGITFLAAGSSVPDCIASVIVARQGHGDMAVSNSIGSNVFDILVGLGVPWFLQTVAVQYGSVIRINSRGLVYLVILVLGSVALMVLGVRINKWRLDKKLGAYVLSLYVFFLCFSVLIELNVFTFLNLTMC